MDIYTIGNMLFRYGEIVKDSNTLTAIGWERVSVIRYEGRLYWVKMRKGVFLEIQKIS